MKRILVFGMTENPGGVESFLLGYYKHIDKSKIQFDFLCNTHKKVAYEDELTALGGRVFHITARSENRKEYSYQLEAVFQEHAIEWDAIWVNVCSLANIDYLVVAKKNGIKKRIIHSHNSQNMDSALRKLLHQINKLRVQKYATDYWACSDDAARWFYSEDVLKKAIVIHNAVDVERMQFDQVKRDEIRSKYGWNDKYVIGNVGRFHFQKNHPFMIDVFSAYHKNHPDSVLVLVGQGEDEKMLKEKIQSLQIEESVFFVGVQKDIQAWLSSFDLFLFPSKFEGLSIAALEAQVNGVPVLASNGVIPVDVKMNSNFIFFNLDDGIENWSKKIEEIKGLPREEYKTIKCNFIENGYDISTEVKKIEGLLV